MLTRKPAPPGRAGEPAGSRPEVRPALRRDRQPVPLGSVAAGLLSGAAVGFLTATARRRGAPSADDYRAPHPSAYRDGQQVHDLRAVDRAVGERTPRTSAVAGS